MKAILIDDEQRMLEILEAKITQLSDIEVLGTFTNPHLGLIEISKQEPDVMFLNIHIEGVNWKEVSRQIKNVMPKMKIVVLTTIDENGGERFDVQADDYILKPFEDAHLQKVISKFSPKKKTEVAVEQPMIGCFYKLNFCYYGSNKDMLDVTWRTSKAREVFAYLVHERGELVRKDVIVDLFWPESSVKEAFSQLYSTIYQIRKSLASIEFDVQIISSENNYMLELNNQLVDVDVWEEDIDNLPLITSDNVDAHKKLIYLYKGDYFEEEHFMWAVNERNRLRVKWLTLMKRVLDYYISVDEYGEAILLNLYYQKIAPYKKNSYFELMKLYAQYGDRYAVEEQYRLLKDMLDQEFEVEPDRKIVAWYENWKK